MGDETSWYWRKQTKLEVIRAGEGKIIFKLKPLVVRKRCKLCGV